MPFKRAMAGATAVLIATATTVAVAHAAEASPLTSQWAEDIRFAAQDADAAFIAGDWDEVRRQLAMFDDSLERLLYDEQLAVDYLANMEGLRDDANEGLEDAEEAVAAVWSLYLAIPAAEAAYDQAQQDFAEEDAALNAAIAARDAVPVMVLDCFPGPNGLDCFEVLNPARIPLDDAVTEAQAARHLAALDSQLALAVLEDARAAWEEAGGNALMQARYEARETAEAAQGWVESAETDLEWVREVIASSAPYIQSLEDRRADLEDLETVKRTVTWTAGADNEAPRAGDALKLTFSLRNTELFDLSGAEVRIVTPHGVAATCDIADGVVPAGALVTCTALYDVTEADSAAGQVVFEVELTGYLPLGPGNPRSQAATRTLITVTESLVVEVVAEAEADEVLAETGMDSTTLGAFAAAMIIAGGALLVARRRLASSL